MKKMTKNGRKWSIWAVFNQIFLTDLFSKMNGIYFTMHLCIGSEKPTGSLAMLRHIFRVTTVKEGCVVPSPNIQDRRDYPLGYTDNTTITSRKKIFRLQSESNPASNYASHFENDFASNYACCYTSRPPYAE